MIPSKTKAPRSCARPYKKNFLGLTKKQFLLQSPSTQEALTGDPVTPRTPIAAPRLPLWKKLDYSLAAARKTSVIRSGSGVNCSVGNNPSPRIARAIVAFHTPIYTPVDFLKLSFFQKIKFFFSNIFSKRPS